MPDITASPAIDVALGLFFLFFLLSIICSALNEIIAGVLSWRARFLEDGIRSMLAGEKPLDSVDGLVKQLAAHPLIQGRIATPKTGEPTGLRGPVSRLRRKLMKPRTFPSYLNNRTFALVFLDTIAPPVEGSGNDALARAQAFAKDLPGDSPIKRVLLAYIDKADGEVDRLRESIESWFDLTMDRVSGWYKRRTQVVLWAIAFVVALAFNADSLQVGRALWNDDAVRAAVVAQAQQSVEEGGTGTDTETGGDVGDSAEKLSQQVADVTELELPLGWSTDQDDPRWFDSGWGAIGKLFGLLATIFALTLGAPFWFDLLGRVSRIRNTGKPEREGAV